MLFAPEVSMQPRQCYMYSSAIYWDKGELQGHNFDVLRSHRGDFSCYAGFT